MKQKLLNVVVVLSVAAAITCCGTMQKAIKTGDHQVIYEQAMKYYADEDWSRAETLFGTVDHLYAGTNREDSVAFFMARCQAKMGAYSQAAEQLESFRREFGRSVFIEDAEAMYAMCYYYLSPGPKRDQATTQMAISAIYEFISRYPESDRNEQFLEIVEELQERLHEKSYLNAYTYYKIGKHKSSIIAFRNALREYPTSHRREDILYHIVASSYELAYNSIPSKQEDRYLSLLDSYYTFLAEFPESEYMHKVERMAKTARKFLDSKQVEAKIEE